MPLSAIATERRPTDPAAVTLERTTSESTDSLFERVAWLYAFCREHVFRNDTNRIISAVWPNQVPAARARVIELGCGPGFYSRKLAQRFPQIHVTGVDSSSSQLR